MPRYDVKLDDGRTVSFDADRKLTDEEVEATVSEAIKTPVVRDPGLLERLGSAVKDVAAGAYNAVTGADRMTPEMRDMPEGIRELAPTIGGRLKGMLGAATASDNKQRQAIYEENYPGVEFRQDAKGNVIGKYNDREFALNKPGLSQEDVIPAALQGYAYTAGALSGARLAPWLGRAIGVGTGAAATSVGLDTAANVAGGRKDAIEMGKSAALAGGVAAGSELLAPVVGKIYQAVRNRIKGAPIVNGAGGLTDEAKGAMREAGINPDDMGDEFMTMLRKYASDIDDPVAAGRLSQGQSLPVPIQQTRGQLSMDPRAQRLEEAMRAGSYGDTAGQRMRGVAADQQGQIKQNLEAIQTGISGGQRQVVVPGQGGEMVSNRLNQMYDAEKSGVDAAYKAARETNAFVAAPAVDTGGQRITAAVLEENSLASVPKVAKQLEEFAALAPDDITPVRVKELFQWRQQMSGIRADGGAEAKAAGRALKAFDATIDEALDKALMSGDDDAIGLWREAIGKNREFAQRFKGRDMVGDLVERDYTTDSRKLAVDPTSAVNYILGRAKMGPVGKQNIVPDIKKLRATLGADSAEWNALREEAFLRFSQAGQGASPGGATQFSGVNFKTNWNNAWTRDAPLMSQLFTQKEKALIDQFADVAARVTSQAKYGSNPSGSSYAMYDLLLKIPFGRKLREFLQEAEGATMASQALKVPYREVPAGYLGAAGATAGTRDY